MRGVRRLGAVMRTVDDQAATALGISAVDLLCLGELDAAGPMSPGDLVELTGLTSGAITGVVDRLEQSGFVRRTADPSDRRRVLVVPTGARTDEVTRALAPTTRVAEQLRAQFGAEKLALVTSMLGRAEASLRELVQDARPQSGPGTSTADGRTTAPLGKLESARLVVNVKAVPLSIDAGDAGDSLFSAPRAIRARVSGSTVELRANPMRGGHGPMGGALHVALNPGVTWSIELKSTAGQIDLDATGLQIESVDIAGNANQIELSLPAPAAIVPVTVSSKASHIDMRRPKGSGIGVEARGLTNSIMIGRTRVGPGARHSDGSESERYEVEVSGHANSVMVH